MLLAPATHTILVQNEDSGDVIEQCLSRLRSRCGADGEQEAGAIHAIYRPICSGYDRLMIAREPPHCLFIASANGHGSACGMAADASTRLVTHTYRPTNDMESQ